MISKIQNDISHYYRKELFYDKARDAMFDIVNELNKDGYQEIYIPAYIGWSSKEGSGIFDPLNEVKNLKRNYYPLDKDLTIKLDVLKGCLSENSILLIVNYFGFRDKNFEELIDFAHSKKCIVIEDNAHGFYTYHLSTQTRSDFSFFSLHKMFPFQKGGSLIINNNKYSNAILHGDITPKYNPYEYDIFSIAMKRKNNFDVLYKYVLKYPKYIEPLRKEKDIETNVPQTFPIILLKGNRDKVYDMMNEKGYGVVTLYHTMIKELQKNKYDESLWVARHIMNLPIHQDVDCEEYEHMIEYLIFSIKETM